MEIKTSARIHLTKKDDEIWTNFCELLGNIIKNSYRGNIVELNTHTSVLWKEIDNYRQMWISKE